ncbi:ATPase, T2SS/T4P/T4SS family [Biostraticola tofi]|uniref:Protein transport protein HofB n=1 Tax=Biostraticola tofi TaxID=466109 RepID=A0A4R3Z5H8_9GAMM|nr:ATPase, T2SS/T4P/T4SS family [Biostraticola tofi]TCV99168.1 protein transport protein HofB [Biostraticola tofi]
MIATRDDHLTAEEFIDQMLSQAIAVGASDIHLDPCPSQGYRLRMRIDGLMQQSRPCPAGLATMLAVRLKIMARLDIAERRLPQDGQFIIPLPAPGCSFRLSTLPALGGEKIALRLLPGEQSGLSLRQLGMTESVLNNFLQHLQAPQGMILLTGPTGSGKTMTLYAALVHLRQRPLHICSVEDPVEIPLSGITQCQVNLKARLDFPLLLRALLRQDPDVIMVGEIRDAQTAAIAAHAARSAHLVLATLHCATPREALARLSQLGLSPDSIEPVLRLVMAQRLVRRLCPHCRRLESAPHNAVCSRSPPSALPHYWQAVGCGRCHGGYEGRCGLFSLSDKSPGELSHSRHSLMEPAAADADGLWQAGLSLAAAGETTVSELWRVLG